MPKDRTIPWGMDPKDDPEDDPESFEQEGALDAALAGNGWDRP